MKVFFLKPEEDWFVDRMGDEFARASEHDVLFSDVRRSDVIWLAAPWCWRRVPQSELADKPVLCTIHHEVPWKIDAARRQEFAERDQFVDLYHVPCAQTRETLAQYKLVPVEKIRVLPYWCDSSVWKEHDSAECRAEFGLLESQFIVGSFQRDTEGGDLKTPKLEKGPDLFCDYVIDVLKDEQKLDVRVFLSGWRRQYAMKRLADASVPYTYIELPQLDKLSRMYSALDLYVVSSRFEGGPQALLECAMQRVPIVSRDMGMARDVLHSSCIVDVGKLPIYKAPSKEAIEHAHDRALSLELRSHARSFDSLLRELR